MKNIIQTKSNGFYLFAGSASGNSSFIENESEAKLFKTYFSYYLKDFIKLYDYNINEHGWNYVLKLRSEKQILNICGNNKRYLGSEGTIEIWRVISERVRLALSTFVRVVNKRRNRTGGLVHSKYTRYIFHSKDEALAKMASIRMGEKKVIQPEIKYRPLVEHYKQLEREGKVSYFVNSGRENRAILNTETYVLEGIQELVIQKMVLSTFSNHLSLKI